MLNISAAAEAAYRGKSKSPAGLGAATKVRGLWRLRAYDPDGVLIDQREWENLVVTTGRNYLLSAGLDGATQVATWYVGLTDGTPTAAAADTMASHGGWVEVTAYGAATRVAWVGGTAAAGSIDNSASAASFAVNADSTTIGGAFLASDSTKGGTTGTLYSVGAFTGGDLVLNNGSTLDVTATFTVSAA